MISVVVPVYNAQRFLPAALDSLLRQQGLAFEVLLVDDGSTDGSAALCERYAARDARIRVFHQENRGVGAARNRALDALRGDWVFFLDADDLLPPGALASLYERAEGADLVIGSLEQIDERDAPNGRAIRLPEKPITRDELLTALFYEERYGYLGYLFPKLFRASLIRKANLRFSETVFYNEDRLFLTAYALQAETIRLCADTAYAYRQHSGSALAAAQKGFSPKLLTELDAYEQCKALLDKGYPALSLRISRLIYESALYWRHRIPRSFPEQRRRVDRLLRRHARICLREKGRSPLYRLKICGHCLLGR